MKKILVLTLSMIVFLSACNILQPFQPEPEIDLTQTLEAAVQSALTATAEAATPTSPLPSPTPLPTETFPPTLEPTFTPTPTETVVIPSLTPHPAVVLSTPTPVPTSTPIALKPTITMLAVEHNRAVTLQADNFPANRNFTIRVGPFHGFFDNYVVTGTLNSGSGGSFKFTVLLPIEVRDVEMVTVRLDSGLGEFAFNAFRNADSGTVTYIDVPITTRLCEVSVSPGPTTQVSPRHDFDAVWTIKNTSGMTWEKTQVDYKYISGVEMQKYEKLYDIPETVKDGETIKIIVDIIAPERPGTYTTHWALVKNSTILCPLPFTVVVK
jgi:hypothetical protein